MPSLPFRNKPMTNDNIGQELEKRRYQSFLVLINSVLFLTLFQIF